MKAKLKTAVMPAFYILAYCILINALKLRDDSVTVRFVVIMAAILLFDEFFPRRRMREISYELLNFHFDGKSNFSDAYMKSRYELYKKEYILQHRGIEEYINIDGIYHRVNKKISDALPGVFTGIGILGTFIGLIVGLKNFDFTNDSMITTSIQSLIGGIQVAFYTSVFGVGTSIVYTFIYKTELNQLSKALDSFYSMFNEATDSEDEYYAKEICNLLGKQLSASVGMPEKIADTLVSDTFSVTLANAVKESVQPTMQSLEERTTEFIDKAVSAQSDILQSMVNGFMDKMNKTLKNQFKHLADSINTLCRRQDTTSEKLEDILVKMSLAADRLDSINQQMENNINGQKDVSITFSENLLVLKEYINSIKSFQSRTEEIASQMNSILEKEEDFINGLKGYDDRIAAMENSISSLSELEERYINSVNEYQSKIDAFSDNIISREQSLTDNNLEIEKQISGIVKTVSAVADTLNQVSENADKIFTDTQRYIRESNENFRKDTEAYSKLISEEASKISETNNALLVKYEENVKNLIKYHEELNDSLNKNYEDLSRRMIQGAEQCSKMIEKAILESQEKRGIYGLFVRHNRRGSEDR